MVYPRVLFPGPGCIVECMQGNRPVQHWVLESQGDGVRLMSASGKEMKMPVARLLPWYGPQYGSGKSREDIAALLGEHKATRERLCAALPVEAIWEMAQGEVRHASAVWLAELHWSSPDADQVAAAGHAALACKTRFKFSPPDFEIYDGETVARKHEEAEITRKREEMAGIGGEFFRALWAVHTGARGPLSGKDIPPPSFAENLASMLRHRIANPETLDDADEWKLLTKSLPEEPHLPLLLAVAWGIVPPHHNFWLDRARYAAGEQWAEAFTEELEALARAVHAAGEQEPETGEGPFISIDPSSTADVDDAFTLHKNKDSSFSITLAFASPAQFWPFGSPLDKAVLRRASSLYLPESDHHMIPRETALTLFSLLANARRPATLLDIVCEADGAVRSVTPRTGWVCLAANLTLQGVEAVLHNTDAAEHTEDRFVAAAKPFAAMLHEASELASILQQRRIAAGAVITERPEADISLETDEHGNSVVAVCHAPHTPSANNLVGELMILANTFLALWARECEIPLFFRTQDVALPKEFAGIWTQPEDISRIVRHLPPSAIETSPRPHAGLGTAVYAPFTSPIRRYTDLVNTGQILSCLRTGAPRFCKNALEAMLPQLTACSETTAQIQRYRPRYWKLLFYKQMGDKVWWDAVVTDENDAFVQLSLPLTQISLRVRRKMLDDKIYPGQRIKVRIGKVHPLRNEIQAVGVMEG